MQNDHNGTVPTNPQSFSSDYLANVSCCEKIAANSLFRNILRIKSLESRFWPTPAGYSIANYNRINILRDSQKKNLRPISRFLASPLTPPKFASDIVPPIRFAAHFASLLTANKRAQASLRCKLPQRERDKDHPRGTFIISLPSQE